MTQEIENKLQQAAKDYIKPFAHQLHLGADEGLIIDLVGFAQTILDNPQEWDLVRYEDYLKHSKRTLSENERYRKCLEKLAVIKAEDTSGDYIVGREKYPMQEAARIADCVFQLINFIAKEALKKEVNND